MPTEFSNFPILIASLSFLTLFLASLYVSMYMRKRDQKRRLLDKIGEASSTKVTPIEKTTSPSKESKFKNLFVGLFNFFGKRVSSENSSDYPRIRAKFLQAGIRSQIAPNIFSGVKVIMALLFIAVYLVLRVSAFRMFNPTISFAFAFYFGAMGFFMPELWIRIKIAKRKSRIFDALPDALDLMVVCLEAGTGLDSAITRVEEELRLSHKDFSDELKLLSFELMAGKSREVALRNLAKRVDLEEVGNLVTLIIQTDKFGTSVADALRVYSDASRTKRSLKAEEKAAQLPVKLVFPLIVFIFPSIFVVILGPAAIKVYEMFGTG
jgi:tight adherence protein C